MKELSIIIPMYNATNFIVRCIQSAVNQADVEKEIIVVDDGSTDNSVEIAHSVFDDQILIIRKVNGGASSARNVGLKKAQGKYVMFLDSDDWLDDEHICRKCINRMERDNLQMCIFGYKYYNNETHHYIETTPINEQLTQCQEVAETTTIMVKSGLFPVSPCFRIIESEFLLRNGIYFIENTTAEDIEWFTHVLSRISRFGFISDAAYIYRKNISSSVTGSGSLAKCKNLLNRINDSIEHVHNVNDERIKVALLSALAYEYCILLGNIANDKNSHSLKANAKRLSFLLEYQLFPRINYVNIVYKVLGFGMLVRLMGIFIRKFAKSRAKG